MNKWVVTIPLSSAGRGRMYGVDSQAANAYLIRQIQQLGECVDEGEQHKRGVADELCQLAAVALGGVACGERVRVEMGETPGQWAAKTPGEHRSVVERGSGAGGTPQALCSQASSPLNTAAPTTK